MESLITSLQAWGMPSYIVLTCVGIFAITQIIGEIIELCGKTAPTILKVRNYFKNKKQRQAEQLVREADISKTLVEIKDQQSRVEQLLTEVNVHYSLDNIKQRNTWMHKVDENMEWVADQATKYDASIESINQSLALASKALLECTQMTEELFVESSRDRIIDFAEKVVNPKCLVSHEQFRRIFRVYDDYERFLEAHNRTNGEVTRSYQIIQKAYDYRVENRLFIEDLNTYDQLD